MDERFDEYDLMRSGFLCDCCNSTKDVLYTLEVNCAITLCSECIRQFYAMQTKKKPDQIIRFMKRK